MCRSRSRCWADWFMELRLPTRIKFTAETSPDLIDRKHKLSRYLLQASVVGLGFGMNLHEIVHAGRVGFIYTAIGIGTSMLLGTLLGRMFSVGKKVSYLITVGTAICGGSAIAAVAPITNAGDEDIAVSLGTVFVLN